MTENHEVEIQEELENTQTEEKQDYKFLISENYAIDVDSRNIILLSRYEKREGRGKSAPLSGEYGWKEIAYFGTIEQLAKKIVDHASLNEDEITNLQSFADNLAKLKKEIKEILIDKIEIVREEASIKKPKIKAKGMTLEQD